MSSASRAPAAGQSNLSSAIKRRQVRKGTFSCWECKRRKTRCEFRTGRPATICTSCQRRGTSCVGQQFEDPAGDLEGGDAGVEDRIVQVENLVNQLIHQRRRIQPVRPETPRVSVIEAGDSDLDLQETVSVLPATTVSNPGRILDFQLPSLLSTAHKLYPGSRSLSCQLYTTFPHPTKAALILTHGKFFNLPIHIRGKPSDHIISSGLDADQFAKASEPPLPTAHPLQFARKLIQLALCLQQMDSATHDSARQFVDIASQYVTCHDSLMDSIDGIETLLLESCYYINVGNIRRGWLLVRRALTIAQLLGLHLQTKDVDDREENVWFRLMLSDRALSLELGKPLAVTENAFANQQELAADAWCEKLERIHAGVMGRIITRNVHMQRRRLQHSSTEGQDNLYDDYKVTHDIDHELKQAARSLPANWWLSPSLQRDISQSDAMKETQIIFAQLHHYYLLIILHQPYLLREYSPLPTISNGPYSTRPPIDVSYSQFAVLSAGREALSRYTQLRGYHRALSYRGVDDKICMVCMMFLLVHLNGHSLGSANFFEHQRPHDLGIVNRVINLIDETSSANKDEVSASIAQGLKRLVGIEGKAADGHIYLMWVEEAGKENLKIREGEDGLWLPLPYFGSIRIARQKPNNSSISLDTPLDPVEPSLRLAKQTGPENKENPSEERNSYGVPSTLDSQPRGAVSAAEYANNDAYDAYFSFKSSMPNDEETAHCTQIDGLEEITYFNQANDQEDALNTEFNNELLSSWLHNGSVGADIPPEMNLWSTETN
ncbi:hypothetical protein ABW20_dc0104246 [Dactylellina cionopaga]|nr:hypothetical protein ABW20_dc0104246 [Dactylellina cionopaga]